MKVNAFIQSVFASLTQQGSTLLINSDTLLTFTNFGLSDIYNYEGRFWGFQYVVGNTFTTTGASTNFTHTIPENATNTIQRLVSLRATRGTTVLDESVKFKFKRDGVIGDHRDTYYQQYGTTFKVYDEPNRPINYEYSYVKGFKFLTSLNDELPIPEQFIPALHSFVISYCLVPFGQYSDNKEVNFYQKGLQQLANLAKGDGAQVGTVITNIV